MDKIDTRETVEAVIREALAKYDKGEAEYGQIQFDTDKRDFTNEAIDEMLDTINYLAFAIIKLRRLA